MESRRVINGKANIQTSMECALVYGLILKKYSDEVHNK